MNKNYVGLMYDLEDGTVYVLQEEYPTKIDFIELLEHEGILDYEGLTLSTIDEDAIEEFLGYWCTEEDEDCYLFDQTAFDQHFHETIVNGWKGWRFG